MIVTTIVMSRKAVWCFTVPSGLMDETAQDGISVEYASKTYTVVLGPVEDPDQAASYPHQHGYIACPKSVALTKGQAISILKQIGAYEDGQYVHELDSTKAKYHAYCFKSSSGMFTSAERAIKRAWDAVEEGDGVKVTPKRLKAKLAVTEGVSFVARNKPVIDTFLCTPEVRQSGRDLIEEVDRIANMIAFLSACNRFNEQIKLMVEKNGITTTHPAFKDSTRHDQMRALNCIALLPMVTNRARITDGIPALWFHGLPHCGKSFLFSQMPNYKKVATDAVGVSRYRLEGDQSGLLLDDVDEGFLLKPENSKTLKALTLGEREVVKTMGDTQEIRAFVVCTSNGVPDFLQEYKKKEEDGPDAERAHQFNCNAWKRRFVTLFFDEEMEPNFQFIDFEQISLNLVARKLFELYYEDIESETLKALFTKYYNHIGGMWKPEDVQLYDEFKEQRDAIKIK